MGGSPPRARGHRRESSGGHAGRGLTPACAGTSALPRSTASASRAHPRVRGDVAQRMVDRLGGEGSPPRARGRLATRSAHREASGLTPACAGTSFQHPKPSTSMRAHPRVRGDVQRAYGVPASVTGSPPRARGRPGARGRTRADGGLTPACAGTSHPAALSATGEGAHPRVRGDVADFEQRERVESGSPPRARGRPGPSGGRR